MPQTTPPSYLGQPNKPDKCGPCMCIVEKFTRKEVTKTKGKDLINNKTGEPSFTEEPTLHIKHTIPT